MAASSWVAALGALPPKLRLEVQRQVAADVAAQESSPTIVPPFSHAYASGTTSSSGILSASPRPTVPSTVLEGGTANVVAEVLLRAIQRAAVTPDVPFDSNNHANGAVSASAVTPGQDDAVTERHAISSAIARAQLDVAYRPAALRYLQRRLATDSTWAAEAAAVATVSAGAANTWRDDVALVASGELTLAAQRAWESVLPSRRAVAADIGHSSTTSAAISAEDDALLDSAFDDICMA